MDHFHHFCATIALSTTGVHLHDHFNLIVFVSSASEDLQSAITDTTHIHTVAESIDEIAVQISCRSLLVACSYLCVSVCLWQRISVQDCVVARLGWLRSVQNGNKDSTGSRRTTTKQTSGNTTGEQSPVQRESKLTAADAAALVVFYARIHSAAARKCRSVGTV